MKRTRKLSKVVAALAVVGALGATSVGVAGAQSTGSSTTTAPASNQTVVDIAASNPNFSTLVTAVTAAGLGSTLSGTGPFTVFAPTNEAFAKIPKADLDALLADKAKLTKVLTYHVLGSKVMAGDLKRKQKVETVEGSKVLIRTFPLLSKTRLAKSPTIEDAKIVQTDIQGKNGVIHVIDTVLIPPSL